MAQVDLALCVQHNQHPGRTILFCGCNSVWDKVDHVFVVYNHQRSVVPIESIAQVGNVPQLKSETLAYHQRNPWYVQLVVHGERQVEYI